MKPICFIAARGGSKGVPRKNIRLLAGKPLIAHTIETVKKSKLFSSIIVSTEDKKISNIAEKYGADVPFLRPKKLATDTASMTDVLLHGIKKLQSLGYTFDTIVIRDCTVPFIRINDIKSSISLFNNKKCDMVCGVYKQHHNPYFNMMEPNSEGFLHFSKKAKNSFIGRQRAPIVYQLNGLFVIDVKQFLKYKKFYMPKILPYEIPSETGLMIDTEFEFQLAECIAKIKFK
jgi:CMP-N-acetylneuraminic acid synthetase